MTVESIRRIRLRLKPPDGVFNHVRPIWFDPPRGCFLNASLMFYCCMVSSTATPSGARGRDLRDDVDLSTAVIRRLAALSEKYLGLRGSPVQHQTEMPQANKHGCIEQAQAGSSVRPVLSGEKLEGLEGDKLLRNFVTIYDPLFSRPVIQVISFYAFFLKSFNVVWTEQPALKSNF